MNPPKPRPALRRADDAGVHPALSIAPSQAPPTALAGRVTDAGAAGDDQSKLPPRPKDKAGKKGKKAEPFRGAGKATSDVYRARSDKRVSLQVQVPKSVRKELRAVSKASDTPMDELVTEIFTTWLGDPRRW